MVLLLLLILILILLLILILISSVFLCASVSLWLMPF